MVAALEGISPGCPGHESRGEIARSWLQHGEKQAILTYLAVAAGVRSSVARKKGLGDLAFDYVRAVTEHLWEQVQGTPEARYLAARVVDWLAARDPLPESRTRQVRFLLPEDDAAAEGGADPAGGLAAAPADERAAYAELLGVPLDLAPWQRALQELRRLGLDPPEWAAAALLDLHGPRKAGRGEAEVWLLVPGDVDLDAAGRRLWEEGVGKVVEQTVRRSSGAAPQVALGRYADLMGYLRKLRERAGRSWDQVKQGLAGQIPRSDYVTWVEQTRGADLHLGDRRLVVHSPPVALHWLRQEDFLQRARKGAQEVLGGGWSVDLQPAATAVGRRS